MKSKIDDYRGWEIFFDTQDETFYTYSNYFDSDKTKKSFASVKKYIDDFIKENEKFKPVWVETKPTIFSSNKRIKLIGIRNDGLFIYEDEKGSQQQLSEYNEKDYILYEEKNDQFREDAEKIESEIELLRQKKKDILKNITGIELVEYKKSILL